MVKKSAAARSKELNFGKSDDVRQQKMLEARSKEWANWINFGAVEVISPDAAAQFTKDNPDVPIIPT